MAQRTQNLTKEQKLKAINGIAWELLGKSPKALKEQGINPLGLVGATISTREMLDELGINIQDEM